MFEILVGLGLILGLLLALGVAISAWMLISMLIARLTRYDIDSVLPFVICGSLVLLLAWMLGDIVRGLI